MMVDMKEEVFPDIGEENWIVMSFVGEVFACSLFSASAWVYSSWPLLHHSLTFTLGIVNDNQFLAKRKNHRAAAE